MPTEELEDIKKAFKDLEKALKELNKEGAKLHYDVVKKILSDEKLFMAIESSGKKLYEIISYLYYYGFLTEKQKAEIIALLEELSEKKLEKRLKGVEFTLSKIKDWVAHEKDFLGYIPGAKNKEYLRLADLVVAKEKILVIDKAELKLESGELFYNGKRIQGIKIKEGIFNSTVEITGEHYTSEEGIKNIYNNHALISSGDSAFGFGGDNYSYLAEPGKLNTAKINDIRKILGAKQADGCITVKIIASIRHVWIRVKRDYPAKFAIESKNLPIFPPKKNKGFRVRIGDSIGYWAA